MKPTCDPKDKAQLRQDFLDYKSQLAAAKAQAANGAPKKLLLHACCAPCCSGMLEQLAEHFAVTVFFYNPNITWQAEYKKRLAEIKRLLQVFPANAAYGPVAFLEGSYDPTAFLTFARPLAHCPEGGERCTHCFRLRLAETAKAAKAGGFDLFATTLTVSPLKDAARINRLGCEAAEAFGVSYLPSDFKKQNGYLRSLENSKKFGLYRQDYCGCPFSRAQKEESSW